MGYLCSWSLCKRIFLSWYLSSLVRDVLCYYEIISQAFATTIFFSGTIVEELPAGIPRYIKHYQHAADKSLLLQSINKDKRAFKLNLSRQNNSKTSSWSTISYYLKEVESIAFQLTRSVCLKSQAGLFGRGEFAEFAKYFLTLDKRIIKINLL